MVRPSRASARDGVIGTYLRQLLPKNVWLADRLIEPFLGIELAALGDRLEDAACRARGGRRGSSTAPVPSSGG